MSDELKKKLEIQVSDLESEIGILLEEVDGLLELIDCKEHEVIKIREHLASINDKQSAAA